MKVSKAANGSVSPALSNWLESALLETEDYVDKPPELPSINVSTDEDDEDEEWRGGEEDESDEEKAEEVELDEDDNNDVSLRLHALVQALSDSRNRIIRVPTVRLCTSSNGSRITFYLANKERKCS